VIRFALHLGVLLEQVKLSTMTVYISADMEGIAGVVIPNHVSRDHKEYDRFRRTMTEEVNAAVTGAIKGGADRIVVNDSHGTMSNILIEELDSTALLISGSPKPLGMMQGIEGNIDRAFFIGYHASSGTSNAVLEHTTNQTILSVSLNGEILGEIGMNAYLAAYFHVPVVLVAGDSAATGEARGLLGDIETVATKEGITRTSALCLNPGKVQADIMSAAERSIRKDVEDPQLSLPESLTLQVIFHRASHADMAELIPGTCRLSGREVNWSGGDMQSLYRVYRAMAVLAAAVR
jgi:D-amino peptidase